MNTPGIIFILCCSAALAESTTQPAPLGPFCPLPADAHRNAPSFKGGRPLVGTTYFYWYDVDSGCHMHNPSGSDALTHHPAPGMPKLSFKSPDWHAAQLRDIVSAGIDFIMPVYWGVPGVRECWSVQGLPPLVAAHDRMLAEHEKDSTRPAPPPIGMFYDTSTLLVNGYERGIEPRGGKQVDLTTDAGRLWFYQTIRDFFSLIPPGKWARIDGRPVVFLYAAAFAKAIDEKLFEDTRRRFEKDFHCGLYLVRHADWPGKADAWYQWGGAVRVTLGDVVAGVGPGYDQAAVEGRKPFVIDRRGGRFYDEQWELVLRMDPARRPWLAHVETWNEFHEGTDIARSREYGDQYIQATAKYTRLFHDGRRIPSSGKYARATEIQWTPARADGLTLLAMESGDGCWQQTRSHEELAVAPSKCNPDQTEFFLYFDVDDSFLFAGHDETVEVTVQFLDDGGCTRFHVEYDNSDPTQGRVGGAFRPTQSASVGNTGEWREQQFVLPQIRFVNAANHADFRLAPEGGRASLTVRAVAVQKSVSAP